MTPEHWLHERALGFDRLSNEEVKAIIHFTFLWTFFEANSLNCTASARAIQALVKRWDDEGRLSIADFADKLAYFSARYFSNGALKRFSELDLRDNDNPALVEAVLKGENTNVPDIVTAVLIVVYRLRNNLFHGKKWAYGLSGQLDNFTHANAILMRALEMDLPGARRRRAAVGAATSPPVQGWLPLRR